MRWKSLLAGIGMLLAGSHLCAMADETEPTRAEYVRANYTKFEYRIPMRDGVELFTAVYSPNDRTRRYPMLMLRTPYGIHPYGAEPLPRETGTERTLRTRRLHLRVPGRARHVHVRGRVRQHAPARPEQDRARADRREHRHLRHDRVAARERRKPQRQGRPVGHLLPGLLRVGGDDRLAPGAVAPSRRRRRSPTGSGTTCTTTGRSSCHWRSTSSPPSASRARSRRRRGPSASSTRRPTATSSSSSWARFGTPTRSTSRARSRSGTTIVEHPNYDDFWQSRNLLPHLRNIGAAVMVVGGWFDTEDLYGPLKTYREVEANNPDTFNVLVMGPWSHGALVPLGRRETGRRRVRLQDRRVLPQARRVSVLRALPQGRPRAGPARGPGVRDRGQSLAPIRCLAAEGDARPASSTCARAADWPSRRRQAETDASDEFISDPAKPVPYTTEISTGWTREHMTEDQRFAARRPDVLVYTTDVLEEDLTLAGPIRADLWVSTTGTAADWVVKLIDV